MAKNWEAKEEDAQAGEERMHDVKHPAWEYEKIVGFLSGGWSRGLRDCNGVRVKFELCSDIVLGRVVTTSPNTGLEVSVPGRPDVFPNTTGELQSDLAGASTSLWRRLQLSAPAFLN